MTNLQTPVMSNFPLFCGCPVCSPCCFPEQEENSASNVESMMKNLFIGTFVSIIVCLDSKDSRFSANRKSDTKVAQHLRKSLRKSCTCNSCDSQRVMHQLAQIYAAGLFFRFTRFTTLRYTPWRIRSMKPLAQSVRR